MQIYLGNLAPEVDEALLYELVSHLAPVSSVRMPRNKTTKEHQGYGFAQFADPRDAEYVLKLLTDQPLKLHGRVIRAKSAAKSNKDSEKSGLKPARSDGSQRFADSPRSEETPPGLNGYVPRIFVGNLDPNTALDAANLEIPFQKFGAVEKIEFAPKSDQSDTIHAFVLMKSQAVTKAAIAALNGQLIMNRRVRVELEK